MSVSVPDDACGDKKTELCDGRFSVRLCNAVTATGKTLATDDRLPSVSPSHLNVPRTDTITEVEMSTKASLVNAIHGAYTSTGYPSLINSGGPNSSVYGAFLEFRNPMLHSITLPPDETIVLSAAAGTSTTPTRSSSPSMDPRNSRTCRFNASEEDLSLNVTDTSVLQDPVLRVVWKRMFRLLDTQTVAKFAPPATISEFHSTKSSPGFVLPRSTLQGAAQHLQQYPDGIHAVQSSPRLKELLWDLLPIKSNSNGDIDSGDNGPKNGGEDVDHAGEKTTQPFEEPPVGDAPVHLTLIAANSFNHFTLHLVRHQEERVLTVAPLQTLTASIMTRKITAGCLFLFFMDVSNRFAESGPPFVSHVAARAAEKKSLFARSSWDSSAIAGDNRDATTTEPKRGVKRQFVEVPARASTTSAVTDSGASNAVEIATVHVAVEPYVLLGNQSGDIFLFSIFEEKVLQRLNYSGGALAKAPTDTAESPQKQLISSSVSCITEVECGIEKHLKVLINLACASKKNGKSLFTPPACSAADAPSSVFAVGFENGHVLLVCVTAEGAWLSKHLSSFGQRPVEVISMRVPHFFARVWHTKQSSCKTATTTTTTTALHGAKESKGRFEDQQQQQSSPSCASRVLYTPVDVLVVDEDSAIVAISCDGGSVRLFRPPELEIEVCRISALSSNSVGSFLALQWIPSSVDAVVSPDLLVASNEDDTITVYQLLPRSVPGASEMQQNTLPLFEPVTLSPDLCEQSPSIIPPSMQRGLVFVARRLFHRSWVTNLCALPLSSGQLLIATSYDAQTSFWPLHYGSVAPTFSADILPSSLSFEPFLQQCFAGCLVQDLNSTSLLDQSVLPVNPAASISLHTDLTVRCMVAGAGNSRFFVSLCLRGRVKIWEVKSMVG